MMNRMDAPTKTKRWRAIRAMLVVVASMAVVGLVFRLSEAGSLTPTAAPAGTMHSVESIFASLASAAYDSSAVVASKTGSAFQVTKCIIAKMTGGTPCP